MPHGGPISISAKEDALEAPHGESRPGRFVCLSVTDRGEGMDEQTLARAVEPFFTTKGVGRGTGLGLPMVHGLAEQSGGRLVIKSKVGEGTTVELWLPVAPSLTMTSDPAERALGVEPLKRARTVLAVDDDALVLLNTVAMLEDLGHTVLEASSGKEALEILRRNTALDLVITDQAMPNMTGLQLAEAISAERPGLPIVIATGYAELPRSSREYRRLSKPFSGDELGRVVSEATAR
jgi:CheY-like chemotaxis protein